MRARKYENIKEKKALLDVFCQIIKKPQPPVEQLERSMDRKLAKTDGKLAEVVISVSTAEWFNHWQAISTIAPGRASGRASGSSGYYHPRPNSKFQASS